LFAELGVARGRALEEALRPELDRPLPELSPAVGGLVGVDGRAAGALRGGGAAPGGE